MAIITDTYETYDTNNIPEEKFEKIYMFEREETPVFSSAKKTNIKSTSPEWQSETLRAPADNINAQGDELVVAARTPTTFAKNHTQILEDVISVTGTNQAVSHYGYPNEMKHQKAKAMKELKRDIERAIVQNNASVAGSTGTGGEIGGIESFIETNVSRGSGGSNGGYSTGTGLTTAATDGSQRVFTEDLYLSVRQQMYDNGAKANEIHLGSFNKRKMSAFSGNATRTSEENKRLMNVIDFYEDDFGVVSCKLNPRQRARTALLYDMDNVGILMLRKEEGKKGKTHDSMEEYILFELTSRVVEKGLGAIADLTTQ